MKKMNMMDSMNVIHIKGISHADDADSIYDIIEHEGRYEMNLSCL
jgi:hypothetical protein